MVIFFQLRKVVLRPARRAAYSPHPLILQRDAVTRIVHCIDDVSGHPQARTGHVLALLGRLAGMLGQEIRHGRVYDRRLHTAASTPRPTGRGVHGGVGQESYERTQTRRHYAAAAGGHSFTLYDEMLKSDRCKHERTRTDTDGSLYLVKSPLVRVPLARLVYYIILFCLCSFGGEFVRRVKSVIMHPVLARRLLSISDGRALQGESGIAARALGTSSSLFFEIGSLTQGNGRA